MKDIKKMKNYREKYKRYFGINFGSEYVVHHIDGDRSNNDIENLVLLPAKLHAKYHFHKQIVESMGSVPTEICSRCMKHLDYYLHSLDEFIEVLNECNKWYDYKLYLYGVLPNIHGLSIKK